LPVKSIENNFNQYCGFSLLVGHLTDETAVKAQKLYLHGGRIMEGIAARLVRRVCMLAILFALTLAASWCQADQRSDERLYDIDIPALNAAQALNLLAEQTGAILLFPYDVAKVRQANAVAGRYTLIESLGLLLRGSGLSGGLSDKRAIQITLDEVAERTQQEGSTTVKKLAFSKKLSTFLASVFFASGRWGPRPRMPAKNRSLSLRRSSLTPQGVTQVFSQQPSVSAPFQALHWKNLVKLPLHSLLMLFPVSLRNPTAGAPIALFTVISPLLHRKRVARRAQPILTILL